MLRIAELIRSRYFAGFGLIAMVLWAAIAFALNAVQREAVDRAGIEGRNLARSLAEHVASSVRAIDLSLLHLREAWINGVEPFADQVARQREYLKGESITRVRVIGADGRVAWDSAPEWQRIDVADREHFKVHKERGADELYISAPVLDPASKQWTIEFTRPIYNRQKQFAGAVRFSVPPPVLERIYDDIELGERGIISLLRPDGQFLAHSRYLDRASTLNGFSPALKPGESDAGEYRGLGQIDGVDRFFSYRRAAGYPLVITVGLAADTVFAPYYTQRANYLLAGILASALLLALTLLIASKQRNNAGAERTRARLAAIVGSSQDAIVSRSLNGSIDSWNAAAERLFGYSAAEAMAQDMLMIVPPEHAREYHAAIEALLQGQQVPAFDTACLTKAGECIDISVSMTTCKNEAGEIIGVAVITRDITERKQAEERLKNALHEKELLLREVHHAVKNNLQVITSMLMLGARAAKNEQVTGILNSCRNRIVTMGLVHEQVYASENLANINLRSYLQSLAESFQQSLEGDTTWVVLQTEFEEVTLGTDQAVLVGLIANELLSNAFKHAFPKRRRGTVTFSLHRHAGELIALVVADDGAGLPARLDWRKPASVGLDLVNGLVRQMDGDITLENEQGTRFCVRFRRI